MFACHLLSQYPSDSEDISSPSPWERVGVRLRYEDLKRTLLQAKKAIHKLCFVEYLQVFHALTHSNVLHRYLELVGYR